MPFGHVPAVKNYLKLTGSVNKPNPELAQRQIQGLECDKAEQSGQRFWSLIEDICGDAEHFFRNCFVYNLCPLAFFHVSGRNITPAELEVYYIIHSFFFSIYLSQNFLLPDQQAENIAKHLRKIINRSH